MGKVSVRVEKIAVQHEMFEEELPSPELRLWLCYAQELLDHPPIAKLRKSVHDTEVDENLRVEHAKHLAVKDINRFQKALKCAGLILVNDPNAKPKKAKKGDSTP